MNLKKQNLSEISYIKKCHSPLFLEVFIYLILGFVSLYFGIYQLSSYTLIFLYFIIGLIFWTLLEYIVHRFFYHIKLPTTKILHNFANIHIAHHQKPYSNEFLNGNPACTAPIFLLLNLPLLFLTNFHPGVFIFISGTIISYMFYETVHYLTHQKVAEKIPYIKSMKKHHLYHHFKQPEKNFGVSTIFWDLVFRTYIKT